MKRYGTKSIVLAMVILGATLPSFGQQQTGAEVASAALSGLRIDVANLQEGVPTRVEDANVLPQGVWESRVSLGWGHGDRQKWLEERTELGFGLTDKLEGTAGVIYRDNDIDATGSGDVYLKFLRPVLESTNTKSLLGVQWNFPTGKDHARMDYSVPPYALPVNERNDRVDTTLIAVYTKRLVPEYRERVHLEAKYTLVDSAPAGFDSSRLFLGMGYDRQLGNTLRMASVWWEEGRSSCSGAASVLQLGLRHKSAPRLLWGASLNLGLDWPAADWGLTWGAEYGL